MEADELIKGMMLPHLSKMTVTNPALVGLTPALSFAALYQWNSNHRYRKVAMEADEVIKGVLLPNVTKTAVSQAAAAAGEAPCFEFVRPYKQARRREDDISIVTAGMRVRLEPVGGNWVVVEMGLCFGGMAPTTVAASLTEVYKLGATYSSSTEMHKFVLVGPNAAFCACKKRKPNY